MTSWTGAASVHPAPSSTGAPSTSSSTSFTAVSDRRLSASWSCIRRLISMFAGSNSGTLSSTVAVPSRTGTAERASVVPGGKAEVTAPRR